MKLNPR